MRRILSILFTLASFTSVAQTVQTIGAPGTRVVSRGDFISDSIFYLPRTQVTSRSPFQSGALRYQSSDSSVYQWTGTQWIRVRGGNPDSLIFSTRAWRQKGLDSLAALELSLADTATMLSPYVRAAGFGLTKSGQSLLVDSATMATRARVQKGIDSVASLVTTTDSIVFSTRAWRQKGVDSVAALANTKATATGTTNYLSKFTGTSSLGNSIVYATTSEVGISTPSPTHPLDVNGRVRVRTIDSTATGMNMLYADVDGVIKKTAVPAGGTVTSVATGFGLSGGTITTTGTLVADTNSMATRARVQKAVDSLNVNIATKGSGTVTSVAAGTGMSFTTITSTGSVAADTTVLSTRAWRQKGIDSVNANVALKVNISDTSTMLSPYLRKADTTSMLSPYVRTAGFGLTKGTQTLSVDSVTMATRARVQKGIDSVAGLSRVTGSGTTNYLPKWTGSTALGNSLVFDNGTNVLVNTTTAVSGYTFQVAGNLYNTTGAVLAATSGNVGIGTTSASFNLDIFASLPQMRLHSTSGTDGCFYRAQNSGGTLFVGLDNSTGSSLSTSAPYSANIYHSGAYPIIFHTNSIQRMRITSAGDVGIGTSSPSERLHVNGRARIATIDSSASPINMLWADVHGVVRKAPVASGGITGTGISGYIPKWTASGTQDTSQIIQVNGNIGIGTATPGSNKLSVNGATLLNGNVLLNATSGFGFYAQQPLNELGFIMVSRRDPLGADTILAGLGFGTNTYQSPARIQAMSSQSWTGGDRGTYLSFRTTPNDSTLNREGMRLEHNGRVVMQFDAQIKSIDSTSTAINMLYADANGVIKKTAVPASSVTMSTDNMTAASGWTIAYDKTQAYPVNDVNKTVDGSIATVTINTAAYRTTATFNTDQWVHVATVPSGFRPNSDVYFSLPNTVAGASFRSTSSVGFTSYNFYQEETAIRVLPSGNVEVFVGLVSNSADLSGANYVIMPIAVTYNIETYPN